jgi:hypothetical protein
MEARTAVIALYNRLTGDRSMDRLIDDSLDRVLDLPAGAVPQE